MRTDSPSSEREVAWKIKLAMKVGGEYRVAFIKSRHWKRLAEAGGDGMDEEFRDSYRTSDIENTERCLAALA